jgi:hypothetical protein
VDAEISGGGGIGKPLTSEQQRIRQLERFEMVPSD